MPWHALYTYPSHVTKLRDAVTLFANSCYILPSRNILLHEGGNLPETKIGLVFVNIDDPQIIRDKQPEISHSHHVKCRLLYDKITSRPLVIPDKQMEIFQKLHPEDIEELIILTKPFRDYAARNARFVILESPFDGVEGYKIDLHKQKKLAISFGGISLAISNLYSLKIARVFEKDKDPLFSNQQYDRIITHLIGCLQVNGFADDAYTALRSLILLCHLHDNDFLKMESAIRKEKDSKEKKLICMMDAVTAGLLQSLTVHLFRDNREPDLSVEIPEQRILPFLTPVSGYLGKKECRKIKVDHSDFIEIIKRVSVEERVADPKTGKSKLVHFFYYAHVGIREDTGDIFSNFDIVNSYFDSLNTEQKEKALSQLENNQSLLTEILVPAESPTAISVDDYIRIRVKAIEHLFQAPRLAQWRKLLPQIWIHQ